MPFEFKLPSLGEQIESGDVLSILVAEGDDIAAEQDVLEIETDKATMAVPCPKAGKITKIHVHEGDTVPVGGVLLTLDLVEAEKSPVAKEKEPESKKEEKKPETEPQSKKSTKEEPPSDETVEDEAEKEETADEEPAPKKSAAKKSPEPEPTAATATKKKPAKTAKSADEEAEADETTNGRAIVPAGPAVRRLARELGVDLSRVPASGDGGRITRDDVLSFVRDSHKRPAKRSGAAGEIDRDDWGIVRREKMSRIRRTIAANMLRSHTTIPQLTNFDDADITDLEKIRQESKDDYAKNGIKLTTLPFLVKAVASALKRYPVVNASIDAENDHIVYKEYVNIGVAVDTERGLLVPVLRDVDQMNIPQIAQSLAKLTENARSGNYTIDDLRGGTFSISNLGAIGGTYSTPLINPPEVAIILAGRARRLPVYLGDKLEPRLMLPLSITYDHRVVDGAAAARFLNEVKEYLAAPGRLLLAP